MSHHIVHIIEKKDFFPSKINWSNLQELLIVPLAYLFFIASDLLKWISFMICVLVSSY